MWEHGCEWPAAAKRLRKLNSSLIISSILFTVFFIVFFQAALSRDVIFFNLDHSFQNIPFRHYSFNILKEGIIPMWCPRSATGFPIFSEGQSGIAYPINWLFYFVLPFAEAYTFSLLAHLFFMGIGTLCLLNIIGTNPYASLIGSLGITFSGYFIRKLMFVNFIQGLSLTPWLIFFWIAAMKRHQPVFFGICGLLVGLQILAGHPQGVFLSLVLFWFIVLLAPSTYRFRFRFKWGVIATGLGMMLGAWQWIPSMRLLQESTRGPDFDFSVSNQMAFPPGFFPTWILGDPFGNAAQGTFWGNWQSYEWELTAFVGITIFLLACAAVKTEPWNRFFMVVTMVGIVLALGEFTPIYSVISMVPILESFRIPARWLFLSVFGISILAARGLSVLVNEHLEHRLRAERAIWIIGLPVAGLILLGMGWTSFHANGALLNPMREAILMGSGILGFIILILFVNRFRYNRFLIISSFILCSFIELMITQSFYPGISESAMILNPPDVLKETPADGFQHQRFLSLMHESVTQWNWHERWSTPSKGDYPHLPESLPMYSGMLYGFDMVSFDEWSPMHYGRYVQLARQLNLQLMSRMSLKYILAPPRPLPFSAKEMKRNQDWVLLENGNAVSRAVLVQGIPMGTSSSRIPFLMNNPRYHPESQAFIEGEAQVSSFQFESVGGRVQIIKDTPHEVEIRAEAEKDCFLVLADAFDPGWKAVMDDHPTRIYIADYLFRGVRLPAGQHQVCFQYFPLDFHMGLFISLCSLILWITGMTWIAASGVKDFKSNDIVLGASFIRFFHFVVLGLSILVVSGLFFNWRDWCDSFGNWNARLPAYEVTKGDCEVDAK